jgi:hypothetical protein
MSDPEFGGSRLRGHGYTLSGVAGLETDPHVPMRLAPLDGVPVRPKRNPCQVPPPARISRGIRKCSRLRDLRWWRMCYGRFAVRSDWWPRKRRVTIAGGPARMNGQDTDTHALCRLFKTYARILSHNCGVRCGERGETGGSGEKTWGWEGWQPKTSC